MLQLPVRYSLCCCLVFPVCAFNSLMGVAGVDGMEQCRKCRQFIERDIGFVLFRLDIILMKMRLAGEICIAGIAPRQPVLCLRSNQMWPGVNQWIYVALGGMLCPSDRFALEIIYQDAGNMANQFVLSYIIINNSILKKLSFLLHHRASTFGHFFFLVYCNVVFRSFSILLCLDLFLFSLAFYLYLGVSLFRLSICFFLIKVPQMLLLLYLFYFYLFFNHFCLILSS